MREEETRPVWYGYDIKPSTTINNCDYDEIVVKSEQQVLPIGIVYFRRKVEKGKISDLPVTYATDEDCVEMVEFSETSTQNVLVEKPACSRSPLAYAEPKIYTESDLSIACEKGHEKGYEKGHDDGCKEGHEKGYEEALRDIREGLVAGFSFSTRSEIAR